MKLSVSGRKLLTKRKAAFDKVPEEDDKKKREDQSQPVKLELKDYVALTIAAFETFLLPLVVLIAILAVLALVFSLRL
jgi:hypothetical protein